MQKILYLSDVAIDSVGGAQESMKLIIQELKEEFEFYMITPNGKRQIENQIIYTEYENFILKKMTTVQLFSLLNKNQITEKSFTKELNFLHLKKEASRLIVTEFEKRMKQTIMHKELGKKISYQYLIRLEAYKLIKHLIGEKEYEGFRIWW